jgi:transcriptional regulator
VYRPAHFREERLEVLHALIRAHPLGALVTAGPDGLAANHVPFLVDSSSGLGTLRCHLARANPQWRGLASAEQVLVIFQGTERYITPSWYATKRENGKVVPTWNYVVVHAYGRPRTIEDPEWLRRHVGELTTVNEGGRAEPWQVSDAPDDFVDSLLKAIVGVEIEISRLEGKWKVSQNRPEADRRGVVDGLLAEGDEPAAQMAALVNDVDAETRSR